MGGFAVVVLAAGASSRLGRPKQLLPYLGRTLIEHAVRTALASGAAEVIVVLGAEAAAVRERLQGLRVRLVTNSAWAEGMGSSIRCGVAAVRADIDSVVIALGDQPRITPDHLRALGQAALPVVASSYDGVIGAPCAFGRALFDRLMSLSGDEGARSILRSGDHKVETIEFRGANVDVDTPADYVALVPPTVDGEPQDSENESSQTRAPPASSAMDASPA